MRRLVPLGFGVLLLVPAGSLAGQVVHFTDGRSLGVEQVELAGAYLRVVLPGGGELSLPTSRVARWETLAPLAVAASASPAAEDGSAAWRAAAGHYADLIAQAADRHRIDPALLTAVAETESAFDPRAISPKGACGLLQLMPATAARFGVEDVFDVAQNVEGGARYLSWLLDRFEGRTDLALAGYNAGEGAVERHRGIPPYQETRRYVDRVLRGADRLAALAP
jgi:soluble lytic murein transglycosylase-like protein